MRFNACVWAYQRMYVCTCMPFLRHIFFASLYVIELCIYLTNRISVEVTANVSCLKN